MVPDDPRSTVPGNGEQSPEQRLPAQQARQARPFPGGTSSPPALATSRVAGKFTWRQLGAVGAFGMAAVSTGLPWISAPGLIPYSPWDAHGLFWFGGADGLVILVAAVAGAFLAVRRIWPGVYAASAALLLVTAVEWRYITDRELRGEYVVPCTDPSRCLNPAEGIYVLGIAGAVTLLLGTYGSLVALRNWLIKSRPAARR